MEVRDLEGRTWTVRRRWLPRHENVGTRWLKRRAQRRAQRRLERERRQTLEEPKGEWWEWLEPFDEFGLVLVGIALVALLLFWGLPLLLALVDVVFVVLLTLGGVLARLLLRRPWTVEATTGETRLSRAVVGWRASGRAAEEWADELRHGRGQEGGADGAGLLA